MKVTRHRTSPNGYLQIKKASEEDSGNYTCFAQNTVGTSSVSIRLDVGSKKKYSLLYFILLLQVKPTINIPMKEVQVGIDEQVQLVCEIFGSPKPQIMYGEFFCLVFQSI